MRLLNDAWVEGAVQMAKDPVKGTSSHNPAYTAAKAVYAGAMLQRKWHSCLPKPEHVQTSCGYHIVTHHTLLWVQK